MCIHTIFVLFRWINWKFQWTSWRHLGKVISIKSGFSGVCIVFTVTFFLYTIRDRKDYGLYAFKYGSRIWGLYSTLNWVLGYKSKPVLTKRKLYWGLLDVGSMVAVLADVQVLYWSDWVCTESFFNLCFVGFDMEPGSTAACLRESS